MTTPCSPEGASQFEQWARLPAEEMAAAIGAIRAGDLRNARYGWDMRARAAQRAPEGDWRLWLILAGRGFGKTRAGAEWVAGGISLPRGGSGDAVRARRGAGVGRAGWAAPAYDVLQLEDYDWVVAGNDGATAAGIAAATARLGYPVHEQHYLSGFVLNREAVAQWRAIDRAADAGRARGTAEVFVWALPQVMRDGFVHFDVGESAVEAFDDVVFPLAVGREARVEPGFSTAIVTTASGHEQRNADWDDARMRFDAGPGVRSEADMQALIGFFRARRGAAKAFRFRDPYDDSSAGMTGAPGAADQLLGTGDGVRTRFALVKRYGVGDEALVRRITRAVPGSVRVSVGGVERLTGWALLPGGEIGFEVAPASGAAVAAGYRFDVPVRFESDLLEVSRAGFLAGEAVSVPLVEVREG